MSKVEPGSLKELHNWVNNRIETKKPFRICGNNSRIVRTASGKVKDIPEDILSLKKINGTKFFDPDDMVVGVEAGMSIRTLQEMLAGNNMVLPVNPWYSESCVGSVVACNDFGPNRMDMGGIRDCIIGIEYINGKGKLVEAGGKVVKNVSGYDLTRMMLGSQGGFGVITAVNFKIMPKPVEPHGMFGVFYDEIWLSQLKELRQRRIPLDWIQAVTESESGWLLGLGYSGNKLNRNRIECEIGEIFGNTLYVQPDGKSFPGQIYTPGEQRFSGFLQAIRDAWEMDESYFHVFATLPTENVFSFPFETFSKENFKIALQPTGGDIHFMHKSTDRKEQLHYLEKIKSAIIHCDGKLQWVNSSPECSLSDLGKYGVSSAYSLIKRLKKHLDPACVFFSPYYDLKFDE